MITGGVSDAAWHSDEARKILDRIGQQTAGKPFSVSDALAAAQVHATLAVAEAIREKR